MNQSVVDRVTPIFREVLQAPGLILTRELDATQVKNWDSLNHISLIIALETELEMEFDTEELIHLANVGEMIDLIESKLKRQ
jgi:acyl carrier protein